MPDEWTKKITPLPIGANVGACGTAAFLKQTVIVSDIASDPLFARDDYRSEALRHGLRAAWSQPLVSKEGRVLGTFALYYNQPRIPTEADLRLIEEAGSELPISFTSRFRRHQEIRSTAPTDRRCHTANDHRPGCGWDHHLCKSGRARLHGSDCR